MVAKLRPTCWSSLTWLNQPPKLHGWPHEYYPTITCNKPLLSSFHRLSTLNPRNWGGSPEKTPTLIPIRWGCSPVKISNLNPNATPFEPSHFELKSNDSEVSTAGESASEFSGSPHGWIAEEPLFSPVEKGNKIDPFRIIRFKSCVEEDDLFFDAIDKDVNVPNPRSEAHATGLCKPCAWFHDPRSCGEVHTCQFCHICPPNEPKKRRAMKIRAMKTAEFIAIMGWDSDSEYKADLPISTNKFC